MLTDMEIFLLHCCHKRSAIDYLAKPADADDVEKALLADPQKSCTAKIQCQLIE